MTLTDVLQIVLFVVGMPILLTVLFFVIVLIGVVVSEKLHPTPQATKTRTIYLDDYMDDWPIPYDGDGLGGWSS